MMRTSFPADASRYRRMSLLALLFLVVLRLLIGFHFFQEGLTKVRQGKFTSAPFLAAAKGPLAEQYQAAIPDYRGLHRLAFLLLGTEEFTRSEYGKALAKEAQSDFKELQKAIGQTELKRAIALLAKVDPSLTDQDLWKNRVNDFHQAASDAYLFNEEQVEELQRAKALAKIQFATLYSQYSKEISEYLGSFDRVTQLKDDPIRQPATGVASLAAQRDDIAAKWQASIKPVLSELDQTIVAMENRIQAIGTPAQQLATAPPKLQWPTTSPLSLAMVDKIIPIFDLAIGILLLLGLLTPIAATAAGLFLVSVVLSQFPGYPGSQATYFQAVEAIACFFLAASDAGRFGGLDYLSWTWWQLRRFGGWQPE